MATTPPVKVRDAERSRRAILDAAERLFARQGFDGASLADIGEAAGLSRATPSYFFGSKEELYRAVLERMYADRTAALEPVFAPLARWEGGPLRPVLRRSIEGYLGFLRRRRTFVDIIEREALAGGDRLRGLENQSTVMEDAFSALRRAAPAQGLREFDVPEAVICLVALAYTPVAHRNTMLRRHDLSFDDPEFLARRTEHIADVLMHLLGAGD